MTVDVDVRSRMAGLAEQLTEAGALDPPWRAALDQVPRHLFIPNVVWHQENGYFRAHSRDDDSEWWWNQVYGDEYIVTQVDDGATPPDQLGSAPTCSASMPSLVFWMLDQLDVREGQRVLEIGTGTGFSSALLSARLGGELVTTVEVDPALAEQARAALAHVAQRPTVITGDGAAGYPPHAPYDRVIATCSVQRVPHAWVAQARPGAVIVTPWGTPFTNGDLARLTVHRDGTASGRFVGGLMFMRLRSQRVPHGHVDDFVHHEDHAKRDATTADLWDMFSEHAEFGIGLRVPRCHHIVALAKDDSGEFTIWVFDMDASSWASVDYEPGEETHLVRQYGPRRLWDEVEAAYQWWVDAGRPERERFGLTVTPETQHVWLDEPSRTVTRAS